MINRLNFKVVVLIFLFILINQLLSVFLNTNELLYQTLITTYSKHDVNKYLEFQDKWKWVGYIVIVCLLLIKIAIVSIILYIGLFFLDKKLTFTSIWNIAITAEFIFILVPIFKIIWFCFFKIDYTLLDIQNFYPLSALNIVGYKGLETWYVYPFQTLNLFELAYWLILAYFIGKETDTNMDKGLKIVAYSYGPALLLWITTVMFFTLNYS
jgi:hypothetical protein